MECQRYLYVINTDINTNDGLISFTSTVGSGGTKYVVIKPTTPCILRTMPTIQLNLIYSKSKAWIINSTENYANCNRFITNQSAPLQIAGCALSVALFTEKENEAALERNVYSVQIKGKILFISEL